MPAWTLSKWLVPKVLHAVVHSELLTRILKCRPLVQHGLANSAAYVSLGNRLRSSATHARVTLRRLRWEHKRKRRQHIPLTLVHAGQLARSSTNRSLDSRSTLSPLPKTMLVPQRLLRTARRVLLPRLLANGTRVKQHLSPRGLPMVSLTPVLLVVVVLLVRWTELSRLGAQLTLGVDLLLALKLMMAIPACC